MLALHLGLSEISKGLIVPMLLRSGMQTTVVCDEPIKDYELNVLGLRRELVSGFSCLAKDSPSLPKLAQDAQLIVLDESFAQDLANMMQLVSWLSKAEQAPYLLCFDAGYRLKEMLARQGCEGTVINAFASRRVFVKSPELLDVENYFALVASRAELDGSRLYIEGLSSADSLDEFYEAQLFSFDLAQAACAYIGLVAGHESVKEALNDSEVKAVVLGALDESIKALEARYLRSFETEKELALKRLMDEHINEDLLTLSSSPLRKLGASERIFGPIYATFEHKLGNENLALIVAASLCCRNNDDSETAVLTQRINQQGVFVFLDRQSNLDPKSEFSLRVARLYERMLLGDF